MDLSTVDGGFIVKALWLLARHIEQQFATHDAHGISVERAVRDLRKAWSGRAEVSTQLAGLLESLP